MTDQTYTLRLDVGLLRRQRDWLLELAEMDEHDAPIDEHRIGESVINPVEGLVSLCDELLDQAEGYSIRHPGKANA